MSVRPIFLAGSFLLALACTSEPTAPKLTKTNAVKAAAEGDACTDAEGRSGYFVRSGNKLICRT